MKRVIRIGVVLLICLEAAWITFGVRRNRYLRNFTVEFLQSALADTELHRRYMSDNALRELRERRVLMSDTFWIRGMEWVGPMLAPWAWSWEAEIAIDFDNGTSAIVDLILPWGEVNRVHLTIFGVVPTPTPDRWEH